MSRYIQWGPLLALLLLILISASSTVWLPLLVPLAQDEVVAEAFPCPQGFSAEECALLESMAASDPAQADTMIALMQEPPVAAPAEDADMDSMMAGLSGEPSATVIRTGSFTRIDALHYAEGTANLWEFVAADGQSTRYLRFEEGFEAANGPDLYVYLSANPNPRSMLQIMQGDLGIELGRLKGNIGAQNYAIPAGVDLTQYSSVVIYCRQFEIVFSVATLEIPIR